MITTPRTEFCRVWAMSEIQNLQNSRFERLLTECVRLLDRMVMSVREIDKDGYL